MQRLWAADHPLAVRDLLDGLRKDRAIAYTTVMTVVDNLYSAELVTREKDGRAYRYLPTLTREQHAAGLLGDALAQSSDRGAALLNFVGQMSEDDLEKLRAALAATDADEEQG